MSRLRELIRAPFLSPLWLCARALLLAVFFGVCEIAGWREHTTFISGTATSVEAGINTSVTLGLIYMIAYFGFVLAAPILILASGFLVAWKHLVRMCSHKTPQAHPTQST